MTRLSRRLLITLIGTVTLSISVQTALAETMQPLYTTNQNPLIQLNGLPPLEKGIVSAAGTSSSWTILNIVSNSIAETRGQESITLDGETYRFNFMFRHGLKQTVFGMKGIEIGVDIPYIRHSGGTLDGFIRNWHNALGLSNSERDQFQENQLRYEYTSNGTTLARTVDSTDRIGDIRLSAAWQLSCDRSRETFCRALRASLKLPTGKADTLSGSGGFNLSLAQATTRTYQRYTFHYGGGLQFNGTSDLLNEQQKDVIAFANAGINYQTKRYRWMELKAQLDGHSAFYDSALNNLGSNALQINLGGTINLSNKTALDIAVTEDIITSTIPDVVFHLALRMEHEQ